MHGKLLFKQRLLLGSGKYIGNMTVGDNLNVVFDCLPLNDQLLVQLCAKENKENSNLELTKNRDESKNGAAEGRFQTHPE